MNSPTPSRKAGPSRRPTHTPTPSTPPRPIPITPDHPNPSRKGSAALSTTDRRARRAQLRDFYGLPGDTPLSVSFSPKGGRKKIDKAEDKEGQNQGKFNATIYYENLISRADLAELMGTASKLNNEIAGLHSSVNSLVYNHHHQLFAAGDTIAVLNSRTPQLLSIVTNLQDSFSSISQLVDSIALPEIPQEPIDPVKAGIRRIRLMVIAEGMSTSSHPLCFITYLYSHLLHVQSSQATQSDEYTADRRIT
ncbi:hypothetical protein TREMEDRAFT_65520 [Tremella mesenterica DSM 1558]|uniref:uncharacterized protein n=1 Tax=Tremella mesenterica (strain ATCC 24925 / CBS 8224 / DSM 1558 / NBRC 9311 / NRRL Y-6157 / RJB 2259-6 / UBC 559-6) TaxID=578456 RepID=UPI00032D22FC|nr:uncharacterized protein TREMEDRAFT_65520 [Tremella mesenterica DSM 1558]EIW66249.1 hypothetical protein TREMEDRAFT_65520 [Tremella mesenterica DSM 1558]